MNMFITDSNVNVIPKHYSDVHLRKMILEQTQLLCNSHRVCDGRPGKIIRNGKLVDYKYTMFSLGENNSEPVLYLLSHMNHPISVWVCSSVMNYRYSYYLLCAMHEEYEYRFGKTHKSKKLLVDLRNNPCRIKGSCSKDFPICVEDHIPKKNLYETYQMSLDDKYKRWCLESIEIDKKRLKKKKVKVEWSNRIMPSFLSHSTAILIESTQQK